ncbi:unnamed protein product [Polarella glacialis]|uniref:Uncharacterized protein n=1 Tax=Polarella glacialis TaxID=89957 RepID=A0A813IJW4_POLGL|nr:unnamed protein product [Polarella glacialis]
MDCKDEARDEGEDGQAGEQGVSHGREEGAEDEEQEKQEEDEEDEDEEDEDEEEDEEEQPVRKSARIAARHGQQGAAEEPGVESAEPRRPERRPRGSGRGSGRGRGRGLVPTRRAAAEAELVEARKTNPPWPGFPRTPDPLGEIPFALLDGSSGQWLQCDACACWLQVHPECITIYKSMKFFCRYLTLLNCHETALGDTKRRS